MNHRATGNRCGHNPGRPCLAMGEAARVPDKLPPVLQDFLRAAESYYWHPYLLPTLNRVTGIRRVIDWGIDISMLHPGQRLPARRMRSERREACVRLLKAIALCTDLASLRVGRPTSQGFVPRTIYELAKIAGLPLARACRAASDLRDSGLVTVDRICEYDPATDRYTGYPAVRTLKACAFTLLGISEEQLKRARDYVAQKIAKAAQAAQRKISDMTRVLITSRKKRRLARMPSQADIARAEDRERNRAERLTELTKQMERPPPDLDLSPAEHIQQLRDLLNQNKR